MTLHADHCFVGQRGGADLNNDLACWPLLCRAEGGKI